MTIWQRGAVALGALLFSVSAAQAELLTRAGGESEQTFIDRALSLTPANDEHITRAKWNGHDVVFADYTKGADRVLVALDRVSDGEYWRYAVTTGEEEGGTASVAAIGFAPMGHGKAEGLIVLLSWPVQHADVEGTLYEVRLFDAFKPGAAGLTPLKALAKHFDTHTCDCERSGEKPEHFPYKTIAAIKAELKRMGY